MKKTNERKRRRLLWLTADTFGFSSFGDLYFFHWQLFTLNWVKSGNEYLLLQHLLRSGRKELYFSKLKNAEKDLNFGKFKKESAFKESREETEDAEEEGSVKE